MIKIKIHRAITEIPSREWNKLVGEEVFPFLEWEWLSALEESGSISPDTGWYPLHICLYKDDELTAAAPLYLRTESGGEYIYDYFWAEAAQLYGHAWYPKMTGMAAATPAEGYRFLSLSRTDLYSYSALLLDTAEKLCKQNRIQSLNLLWADPAWSELLPGLSYTAWDHLHFIWENTFSDFNDYLALFTKNQRKNIRKEYSRHLEQGIEIRFIRGDEAREEHYRMMFELFTITNDKFIPWDARWVNEDFFLRLEKTFRSRTAFVEACRGKETIAMAFFVHKGDRLWGRFWGAYEEVRDLHFAVCYYVPMDYCIKNHIRYFDPGAGSAHKIRRGFRAMRNRSWHKFFDPVLDRLYNDNIKAVNQQEEELLEALNAELPFKA